MSVGSTDLIPVIYGRPAVVTDDNNWCVFASVHDAEHHRQRREWLERLKASHPDRGGSASAFRRVRTAQTAWLKREAKWYARHGLVPPRADARRARRRRNPPKASGRGHRHGLTRRMLALMADGVERHAADIGQILGATALHVHVCLHRIQAQGIALQRVRRRTDEGQSRVFYACGPMRSES